MGILARSHPEPLGGRKLGSFQVRLPPAPGQEKHCTHATITYPADTSGKFDMGVSEYFRVECMEGLANMAGGGPPLGLLKAAIGGNPQVDPCYLPAKPPLGKKWPVVIFCHGLYGSCDMYTQFCRELASLGTICIACEHEDGTACHAINALTGERMYFVDEPGGGVDASGSQEEFSKREVTFRKPFLAERNKEVLANVKSIEAMAQGTFHPTDCPQHKALYEVMRNADPKKFILASHSFGSTAAVHFFHEPLTEKLPFVGAIIADVWWQPDAEEMNKALPVPFVQLLSEEWMTTPDIRKGSNGASNLHDANPKNSLGLFWVRGTTHQWISELMYFFPVWMLKMLGKSKYDPDETMRHTAQYLKASLAAFLPDEGTTGADPKARFEAALLDKVVEEAGCQGCSSTPKFVLPYATKPGM